MLGSAAALVAGGAVAAWSLRRTMFRTEPSGTWYRPDSRVGIPVFAVMVVVLAIKAAHIIEAVRSAQHTQAPIDAALGALDPWTTIVVAFLSAYLGWYQIALTWRAWRSDGWRRLLPIANGARDDREGGLKERVKASLKAARDETKGR